MGYKKFHTSPTPRLGGISIFISLVLVTLTMDKHRDIWIVLILSSLPAFIVGLIEDFVGNINPKYRLIATAISGALFILITGYSVNSIEIFFRLFIRNF